MRWTSWIRVAVAGLVVLASLCHDRLLFPAQAGSGPGLGIPSQGNDHLQSPGSPHAPYSSIPPTSGPHVPWLARWGVHHIPIPWEVQVHNLEDGGVIIHYRCVPPCPETVAALEAIVVGYPTQVILTPEPHLSSLIAITAWERIDTMDAVDDMRIRRFIDAYRGLDHHPKTEVPATPPKPSGP